MLDVVCVFLWHDLCLKVVVCLLLLDDLIHRSALTRTSMLVRKQRYKRMAYIARMAQNEGLMFDVGGEGGVLLR